MRIFVLMATCELRVSRKRHLRDHPKCKEICTLYRCFMVEKYDRFYIRASGMRWFVRWKTDDNRQWRL